MNTAAAYPPDSTAWRALPAATRNRIVARAKEGQPADDGIGSIAAVSYARSLARPIARVDQAAGAVIAVQIAAAALIRWHVIPGLPARTSSANTLVLLAPVLPILLAASLGTHRPRSRAQALLRANLGPAAARRTGAAPTELLVTPTSPVAKWLAVAMLPVVAVILASLAPAGAFYAVVPMAIALWVVWHGPAVFGTADSARLDETGITLPTWRVHLPWTSLAAPELARARPSLRLKVVGPHTKTGERPARQVRTVTKALRPGQYITIYHPAPELLLWTVERYAVPEPVPVAPDDVLVLRAEPPDGAA